jgi:hypothetical protein
MKDPYKKGVAIESKKLSYRPLDAGELSFYDSDGNERRV